MKTPLAAVLSFSIVTIVSAQAIVTTNGASQFTTARPADTPYSVTSRDANSAVWLRTNYSRSASGQWISRTHQYTEIATGLNFKDPASGQWVPSREEIDLLPDGTAAATNGQHQVYFPADIYNGEIRIVMPDGTVLQSRPLALSYDDGSNAVLIATLTNSVGQLTASNQIVYPNCFAGTQADLRYTYTKSGFEQDVILREQLPAPQALGLNPQSARLQVITECFDPPQPVVTPEPLPVQAGLALTDENLNFGAMEMIPGTAFLLGTNTDEQTQVMVGKQWLLVDGRQLLIEEAPIAALAGQMASLPVALANPGAKPHPMIASRKLKLPARRLAKKEREAIKLARNDMVERGVVFDYQTALSGSLTNYTFQAYVTYFLSGNTFLYGTATIEGGCVLKYASGFHLNVESSATLNWQATEYRPVIFTAKDDDTIGDPISGSTGTPTGTYADEALWFLGSNIPTLSHFRMSYCTRGVRTQSGASVLVLYDAQLLNCGYPVYFSGHSASLRNVLISGVEVQCFGPGTGTSLDVENVTFNDVPTMSASFGTVRSTNCIFANVTNNFSGWLSFDDGFFNSPDESGPGQIVITNNPFQTAGGGSFYLTNGCGFQNAGTTNLNPVLLADLRNSTTYPPLVCSNVFISAITNFSPQVPRNTNAPDLGYHYPPMDYLMGGIQFSNASVTISPGTVIGVFGLDTTGTGSPYGLDLEWGSQLLCDGLANNLNRFVEFAIVQENQPSNWAEPASATQFADYILGSSSGATFNFRFTDWSCLTEIDVEFFATANNSPLNFRDCQFHGGMYVMEAPVYFTNCLFEEVEYGEVDPTPSGGGNCVFQNNLFRECSLALFFLGSNNANVVVKDNFFDQCQAGFMPLGMTISYNGYVTNTIRPFAGDTNDVLTNASLDYQVGPFGNYYQPSNSPLINAGSPTANQVSLYHYTVQTNEVIEGTNPVSIGYHYVAVDGNGNPLDSNEDGIPDYLEDANGDGIYDAGDLGDWSNFLSMKVMITQPRNGTSLP